MAVEFTVGTPRLSIWDSTRHRRLTFSGNLRWMDSQSGFRPAFAKRTRLGPHRRSSTPKTRIVLAAAHGAAGLQGPAGDQDGTRYGQVLQSPPRLRVYPNG